MVLVGASFLSSSFFVWSADLFSAPPIVTVSGVPPIGLWAVVVGVWLLVDVVVLGVVVWLVLDWLVLDPLVVDWLELVSVELDEPLTLAVNGLK